MIVDPPKGSIKEAAVSRYWESRRDVLNVGERRQLLLLLLLTLASSMVGGSCVVGSSTDDDDDDVRGACRSGECCAKTEACNAVDEDVEQDSSMNGRRLSSVVVLLAVVDAVGLDIIIPTRQVLVPSAYEDRGSGASGCLKTCRASSCSLRSTFGCCRCCGDDGGSVQAPSN